MAESLDLQFESHVGNQGATIIMTPWPKITVVSLDRSNLSNQASCAWRQQTQPTLCARWTCKHNSFNVTLAPLQFCIKVLFGNDGFVKLKIRHGGQ
jgi:hypothetical protein